MEPQNLFFNLEKTLRLQNMKSFQRMMLLVFNLLIMLSVGLYSNYLILIYISTMSLYRWVTLRSSSLFVHLACACTSATSRLRFFAFIFRLSKYSLAGVP